MVCPPYSLSKTFIATLIAACCVSGIFAFVQYLRVLLAVRNIHSLRSTARYFMASLAAAELLSGFIGNLLCALTHSRNEGTFMKTENAVLFFTTTS